MKQKISKVVIVDEFIFVPNDAVLKFFWKELKFIHKSHGTKIIRPTKTRRSK